MGFLTLSTFSLFRVYHEMSVSITGQKTENYFIENEQIALALHVTDGTFIIRELFHLLPVPSPQSFNALDQKPLLNL